MTRTGCIVVIAIALLIPAGLYCWLRWDTLTAKGATYECRYDYGALEGAWLNLPDDSVARITVHSTEFVGRFSDRMEGRYRHVDDSIIIVRWDKADEDNEVYTHPPYTDTLVLRGRKFARVRQQP